jgi:hypothetical protein
VLALRELEGLSYEIAGVVGAPMGTVMSTLYRTRTVSSASNRSALKANEAAGGISPTPAQSVWVETKDHTT